MTYVMPLYIFDNMQIVNNYNLNKSTRPGLMTKTSFNGYKTVFSKTLDEVILSGEVSCETENKLVKLLNSFIKKKLIPKKLLGKGYSNSVYKIDDKYVLRFSSDYTPQAKNFTGVIKRQFNDIKLYYGEPVAEFDGDIQILKNVSSKHHIPAGVPRHILNTNDVNKIEEYCYNNYLKAYSVLPQKAFDGIAQSCSLLNKKTTDFGKCFFDFANPNNFVLTGKTIKIIDEIISSSYKIDNDVYHLLDAFINRYSFSKYAQYTEKAAPLRKEIFKKIILACEKYDLNTYKTLPPVKEALELSGIKEEPVVFVNNLKLLKKNYGQNFKKHLKMVKEYLDTL